MAPFPDLSKHQEQNVISHVDAKRVAHSKMFVAILVTG